MSDEGLMNVEEDAPAPPAEAAAPPVAAAPAEPPTEPEPAAAEVDAVEVGGQKYVPVGAVIAERKQRQAAEKVAARVNELEEYARESKPYVEFLKANPGLISQRQQPAAPAPTQPEQADPQTEALAKTRNFQVALGIKDAAGRSPSQAALAQIWRTMPASQTADPNVASILALTALGLDSVSHKPAPAAPISAPLVTESQGGAPRRPGLSQLEQNIARDRGVTETKWTENTKGFVPGRAVQLED